jgi:hypothetical protein
MANEGHSVVGVNECHFLEGPEICTDIRLETSNRELPFVMSVRNPLLEQVTEGRY